MFESLVYALVAVTVVSLLSLIGAFTISIDEKTLDRILRVVISFAAGTILGVAYFDLLPEATELVHESVRYLVVAGGFMAFFVLERTIYWFHGHGHLHGSASAVSLSSNADKASIKGFVYLNLIGDFIHNFTDGALIAVSFLADFSLGVATSIAVVFHEIPQEIGDFAVLVYGGLKRGIALGLNFVSGLAAVAGAIVAYILAESIHTFTGLSIAFAAGGFFYLAAAEVIPEMQVEANFRKSAIQFVFFVVGLLLVLVMGSLLPA